jgi:hypothetical protein
MVGSEDSACPSTPLPDQMVPAGDARHAASRAMVSKTGSLYASRCRVLTFGPPSAGQGPWRPERTSIRHDYTCLSVKIQMGWQKLLLGCSTGTWVGVRLSPGQHRACAASSIFTEMVACLDPKRMPLHGYPASANQGAQTTDVPPGGGSSQCIAHAWSCETRLGGWIEVALACQERPGPRVGGTVSLYHSISYPNRIIIFPACSFHSSMSISIKDCSSSGG